MSHSQTSQIKVYRFVEDMKTNLQNLKASRVKVKLL